MMLDSTRENLPVTFRAITAVDRDFLYRVYASTREEELAVLDWDAAQKDAFLTMQFEAQHTYYMDQFRAAAFEVVVVDGVDAGRLYVDRRADEIRIIDIALLPEHRGRGIGSRLLEGVLSEARGAGLPVRIHVEPFNPAMRLYQRLGFMKVEEQGVYHLMERLSPGKRNEDAAETHP